MINRSTYGRALALGLVAVTIAACSSNASTATTSNSSGTPAGTGGPGGTVVPVDRQTLGSIAAPEAPGYDEDLLKVTIQPGVKLANHTHPGIQVARIESGDLKYTILSGTAKIARKGASAPTEDATGPTEVTLHAGDTVYENETLVHNAENIGSVPVVVYQAGLLKTGQPLASPVS